MNPTNETPRIVIDGVDVTARMQKELAKAKPADELGRDLESAHHTMLGSAAIDGSACTVNLEYLNANARFQAALASLVAQAARSQSAPAAQGEAVAPVGFRVGRGGQWIGALPAYDAEIVAAHRAAGATVELLYTTPQPSAQGGVSDEMVSRFLSWRVPADFHPGSGVSFTPLENPLLWPTGTDLLHAGQARAMLEYVLSAHRIPVVAQARDVLAKLLAAPEPPHV